MNKTRKIVMLAVILVMGLWAALEFRIYANAMANFSGIGTDVIVGDLPDIRRWGSSGGETSFTIATTSCNIGDERLIWIANSNRHPVISQNLYRVNDGRIEQLGMSWLKHGFFALSQSLCNQCNDPSNGTFLGVGCSDPYTASLNGSQSGLGPRGEVNAATGFFLWPHGNLPQTGVLDGRMRVQNSDLDPAQNSGARYFIEGQYVHPEDAAAGNNNNNASYREAFVSTGGGTFDVNIGAPPTIREEPGINAWQAVYPDVQMFDVDIPDDGRVVVGILTTKLQGGGYHTEVAIENLTSHQSVRSLTAIFGPGSVTNQYFNAMEHQFELYSSDDWASSINGSEIEWAAETFAQNENANALRWSTLYSFACDSASLPSQLTLGLFRPGTVAEMTINVGPVTITPDSYTVTQGNYVSGGTAELAGSDDMVLAVRRLASDIQSRTEFEVQSTSPTATPTSFEFTLEGAVFARTNVVQTIELFDYVTATWELVDTRDASRVPSPDSVVSVVATGDLSRFVESGTMSVEARILYKSDVQRQNFRSRTDQTIWVIGE